MLVAYVAAFLLTLGADTALVLSVGLARSSGHLQGAVGAAQAFGLSAPGLMAQATMNAVLFVSVATIGARSYGGPTADRLGLRPTGASALGVMAAVTGMVGLSVTCGASLDWAGVRGGGVMDAIASGLHALVPARLALAVATLGLAPGVGEELLFRGLIQTQLARRWGRWPAIGTASLAFGLIHVDPVQGSLAFVAGLFLGWVADRFGGVRPTILAHAVNNALFVVAASVGTARAPSRTIAGFAIAVGCAVWLASLAVLRTSASVRTQPGNPGSSREGGRRSRSSARE
ncbi:MAG: CPBP family intramembrane glutamic endopeptidase [Polyangiaceae bacterium]